MLCLENIMWGWKGSPEVTGKRDESTSAQPLDLSRHAQTKTWGEYSQICVQSADNTCTPWKLSFFYFFPYKYWGRFAVIFLNRLYVALVVLQLWIKLETQNRRQEYWEVTCTSWPFFFVSWMKKKKSKRLLRREFFIPYYIILLTRGELLGNCKKSKTLLIRL